MTNDIFKVTFKGAVLKALGKANKHTQNDKKKKSKTKTQQLRSEEEHEVGTRDGLGKKVDRGQPGLAVQALRCAVLYYIVSPFTEQKMKYVCSDN